MILYCRELYDFSIVVCLWDYEDLGSSVRFLSVILVYDVNGLFFSRYISARGCPSKYFTACVYTQSIGFPVNVYLLKIPYVRIEDLCHPNLNHWLSSFLSVGAVRDRLYGIGKYR